MEFSFRDHGSLCFLEPTDDEACVWVVEHIDLDASFQPIPGQVLLEPRYAEDVLTGIVLDGGVIHYDSYCSPNPPH